MPLYLLAKPSKKKTGTGTKGLHEYMHKNRKRAGKQICYIVEAPQEFDQPGKELDPDAQVWKTYVREADQVDEEMVDGWNKYVSMDVILIFAALFSAISTAFVIESYKSLKQDPADTSSQTLLIISQTLMLIANGSQPSGAAQISALETPTFTASSKDICVNVLWFLSLSLSVAVSLISMLAKEWCMEFMSRRTGPPGAQARRRQQRWDGLLRWRMKEVIMMLPSLIHLSLLLFAIGLSVFLWGVHYGVAVPVVVVTMIAASTYFTCTIVPFFYDFCPYGTVLSRIIKDFISDHRLNRDNSAQDEVTSRALQWMIVTCETPRSVDVALQSLAAADENLPPNELEKINAWAMVKQRLESTDIFKQSEESCGEGALYKRALEAYPILRRAVDQLNYGDKEKTKRLEQLTMGVQSTINGLIHELLSGPRSFDQVITRILERCTIIGPHYLGEAGITSRTSSKYEVDPENLVNEIVERLVQQLKGEVSLDPALYRVLSASFAFLTCCNTARGIAKKSVNRGHTLRLFRGYSIGRNKTAVESLWRLIAESLAPGTLWLWIPADDLTSLKPSTISCHAPMENVLEALWAWLMSTIYSDRSALNRLEMTCLAHGMLYLLANPHLCDLSPDDSNVIEDVLNDALRMGEFTTKIQNKHHAQYIKDISRNIRAINDISAFTPQLLGALTQLRYYSPWDDRYILPTSTVYMFVVNSLGLANDTILLESRRPYHILGSSPIPQFSYQLVQQVLAGDTITHLSKLLTSNELNQQAFAAAQLWVFFNMSLWLKNNLERQEEVAEELEAKLMLLLDQHRQDMDEGLQRFAYRVFEVMLQQRFAPLHEHAHNYLKKIPDRLRGISSCVNLEAEWDVVYPDVAFGSQSLF
ncbi:RNA-directed RNA polymerase L [Rhizoctonia solani]|uniref:RNA-directed RNA polymerase L n=1 Tax=Rhizoctonia solani TaxID=456999 RepID=A0A0K6GDN3_9AGAM|nr:RNA-directed RNA polymerase L [Rhizoctonia solani]